MFIPILLLISLGIVVLYSSSPALALQQTIYAFLGGVLFFLASRFDYRALKPLILHLYLLNLILLLLVFIIGIETRGSFRWIPLGFINFQPSEMSKVTLILSLSLFWSRHLPSWKNIFLSLLVAAPPLMIVFAQPDLGTALTLLLIWLLILFAAGISLKKILVLLVISIVFSPLIWSILRDYQKERFLSFLFPYKDPLGQGYNLIQSVIAVGSGQLWGRGLGHGTQSRLQFLPEFRTDFIFAFISEELGFLGAVVILSIYLVIWIIILRLLTRAKDRFAELILVGVFAMLFSQVLINSGMNMGILPITGITLPLLSYGGSSMLITMLSLGLVESIRRFGTKKMVDQPFHIC